MPRNFGLSCSFLKFLFVVVGIAGAADSVTHINVLNRLRKVFEDHSASGNLWLRHATSSPHIFQNDL